MQCHFNANAMPLLQYDTAYTVVGLYKLNSRLGHASVIQHSIQLSTEVTRLELPFTSMDESKFQLDLSSIQDNHWWKKACHYSILNSFVYQLILHYFTWNLLEIWIVGSITLAWPTAILDTESIGRWTWNAIQTAHSSSTEVPAVCIE